MKLIKKLWYKIKANPAIGVPYDKYIGKRKLQYALRDQTKEINENGVHYLETVEDILRSSNALFYTYAGTLLGIVRDQKLIKWDMDIDYAVVITESFGWKDLERIMTDSGHNKVREFVVEGTVKEQAYQIGKLKIDFFGQFYDGESMVQYSYERVPGIRYPDVDALSVYKVTLPKVTKTKCIHVDGAAVSVPENAEDILAAIYNEDWRIPNPNWKSNSGKCSQLIDGKFGYQVI